MASYTITFIIIKCLAHLLTGEWSVDTALEPPQERTVNFPGTIGGTQQDGVAVASVHLC